MEVTIKISEEAFEHAKEYILEITDDFGPGMCEYPPTKEWCEFQEALSEAEIKNPLDISE